MSDSNTNVEIEDVLSSIRRLVSEDRAGAKASRLAEPVAPAPMVEAPVMLESATVTQLQPRGPGHDRPRLTEPASAETRVDAAIVALNAETGPILAQVEAEAPEPVAEPVQEGELVDTSDLLAEPYHQAGARGAQFVLTPDFLVDSARPAPEAQIAAPAVEGREAVADIRTTEDGPVASPVQPSARPDLSLDDLVSGDALLATFGSVGPVPARSGAWDSDALSDLAPRATPRAFPLHPSLEATIADLEMAVAAQSEEFEPDLGEDLEPDTDLPGTLTFPNDLAPVAALEAGDAEGQEDRAARQVEVEADDRLEWEALEARFEAALPMRRHRFHLNVQETPAPAGYVGINDAFPAEEAFEDGATDGGFDEAGASTGDFGPEHDHDVRREAVSDAAADPAPFGAAVADVTAYGDDFADLAMTGPAVDLDQASDEALLGLGDAIDAPQIALEGDPLIRAESAWETTPSVDKAADDGDSTGVATPARRIFIAPRVDVPTDAPVVDKALAESAPFDADEVQALAGVVTAAVSDALAEELAPLAEDGPLPTVQVGRASPALSTAPDPWQVNPAPEPGTAAGAIPSMDPEALRSLVLELIRQELQGPLGERITRNVRKLVRREISRALENRDLD